MINKYDENNRFDYENGFYLTSEPYRLGNILSHYEIYKKIIDLPGDIVELGVFKGGSIIQFATFRELLENEKSRKIYGFDIFGLFPSTENCESDKAFVSNWNEKFINEFVSEDEIIASLAYKKIENVHLIKGNILDTLPQFLLDNPHLRISLLHIDTDVYEPSKAGLELLWDRIVKGGILLLDDYGTVEGETNAVDEFFSDKPQYTIHKLSLSHQKPSFIIKE